MPFSDNFQIDWVDHYLRPNKNYHLGSVDQIGMTLKRLTPQPSRSRTGNSPLKFHVRTLFFFCGRRRSYKSIRNTVGIFYALVTGHQPLVHCSTHQAINCSLNSLWYQCSHLWIHFLSLRIMFQTFTARFSGNSSRNLTSNTASNSSGLPS